MKKSISIISLILIATFSFAQKKVSFSAADGLEITADLYVSNSIYSPFILLFHQAGWSRGEYQEIAPKLVEMGYNCMAIDQRSGGEVNGVVNETFKRAQAQGKNTTYIDAEIDLKAAIAYVKKNYGDAELILWGSSYSASLVLKIAATDTTSGIEGAIAFAPGEYFEKMGKPADFVKQNAKNVNVSVFITSAKAEKDSWWSIYEVIPASNKQFFLPEVAGRHGASALWEKTEGNKGYWSALELFLETL